jgi:VanZ family protein
VRLIAPLAMMAVIFAFSAQPFDGGELAWWEVVLRKVGHFSGYAILAALWVWALAGRTGKPVLWAAVISLLYAASDEYHQTFVDGRTGTVMDVGIDALGIAFASAVLTLQINRERERRRAGPVRPAEDRA